MCVIAYVEKGRQLNKKEFMECFLNNPDGAGIMYQESHKKMVHIQKGFMTFNEFWQVAKRLPTDIDRVFHFRIATSGAVSQGICHPFPVCNDFKKMKRLDIYSQKGMVHNGVLSEFAPKNGLKADYSDTMKFNKDVIFPLQDTIFNEKVQDLIVRAFDCRYIVMDYRRAAIIGDWVQSKESGILYSNSSYKKHSYFDYYGCDYYAYEEDYITVPVNGLGDDEIEALIEKLEDSLYQDFIDVYEYEVNNNYIVLVVSKLDEPLTKIGDIACCSTFGGGRYA